MSSSFISGRKHRSRTLSLSSKKILSPYYSAIPLPDLEAGLFDPEGKLIEGKSIKFSIKLPTGYTTIKPECNDTYYLVIPKSNKGERIITISKQPDSTKQCLSISYMEKDKILANPSLMMNPVKECKDCSGSSYIMVAYNVLQVLIDNQILQPLKMEILDIAMSKINLQKPLSTSIFKIFGMSGDSTYNYNLSSYNLAIKYRTFYEAYGFVPSIRVKTPTGEKEYEPYTRDYLKYFKVLVKQRKALFDRKIGEYTDLLSSENTYRDFWRVDDDEYIEYLWTHARFNKIIKSVIAKLSGIEKYKDTYQNYTLREFIHRSIKTENNSNNNKLGLSMAHDIIPINSTFSILSNIIFGTVKDKDLKYFYPAHALIPAILSIYKNNHIQVFKSYYSIIKLPMA